MAPHAVDAVNHIIHQQLGIGTHASRRRARKILPHEQPISVTGIKKTSGGMMPQPFTRTTVWLPSAIKRTSSR
jgi:hypothetical protein